MAVPPWTAAEAAGQAAERKGHTSAAAPPSGWRAGADYEGGPPQRGEAPPLSRLASAAVDHPAHHSIISNKPFVLDACSAMLL